MIFKEQEFTGRDGTKFLLRSPRASDSAQMLEYLRTVSEETNFMLRYPEEITLTPEEEAAFLTRIAETPGELMISVFKDGRIVGNSSLVHISPIYKARHRAEFGIALVEEVWHLGLGRELMTHLTAFARDFGYEQVELEAATANTRALELYRQMGFEIFGERPRTFKLKDGSYLNEYLMVLALTR